MSESISFNGVDPEGMDPPDEIFYRPDFELDISVELLRKMGIADRHYWVVKAYVGDYLVIEHTTKDFSEAFSKFAQIKHKFEKNCDNL